MTFQVHAKLMRALMHMDHDGQSNGRAGWSIHLERRQPKGVATVLDTESAEKVAVHGEHDGTPGKSSDTLSTRVCHAGDLESKRNGRKGKNGVCGMVRVGTRKADLRKDLHMAATI